MRVVVQRVSEASVSIDGSVHSAIKKGFLLLVGVSTSDTVEDVQYLVQKVRYLRVFEDEEGKMNRSLHDIGGEILSISQFTLLANTKKGNRPSFVEAARPEQGLALYEAFNEQLMTAGCPVKTGVFGADMKVSLVNDGPVTILIDSKNK